MAACSWTCVTATYVTPLKFEEISYAAGLTWVAFGNNFIKGQVQVGNLFGATREGDYSGVGDLILTPLILGWHSEYFHILGMTNIYTPVGSYNPNRILNIGLNRLAVEPNFGSPSCTPNWAWKPQFSWDIP